MTGKGNPIVRGIMSVARRWKAIVPNQVVIAYQSLGHSPSRCALVPLRDITAPTVLPKSFPQIIDTRKRA